MGAVAYPVAMNHGDGLEEFQHQLLDIIGIPAEQHAEIIANRHEIARLRRAEQAAIEQNANAVAAYVGQVLRLPEGLTFEYR